MADDQFHGIYPQSQPGGAAAKAVAFPEDVHQVDILKIGRSRLIVPQGKRWDDLFQHGPRVSEDFMSEREQPPARRNGPAAIGLNVRAGLHKYSFMGFTRSDEP